MSSLSVKGKQLIENLFILNGYVLDFSNTSFQRFILDSVNIDIYEGGGYLEDCSKANKLRQVIQKENNNIIKKLITDLLEYYKIYKSKNDNKIFLENKKTIELNEEIEKLCLNNNLELDEILDEKMKLISTRNAKFLEMSVDEKLKELVNLIENLLRVKGKYVDYNYAKESSGFIDSDFIKNYKKRLQCFRHSSEESIEERKTYSEKQKNILIDLGIFICNLIYKLKCD